MADSDYIVSDAEGLAGPTPTLTIEESQATPQGTVTVEAAPAIFSENQVNRVLSSQDDSATVNTTAGVGAGTARNPHNSVGSDNNPGASASTKNATVNSVAIDLFEM